MDVHSVFQTLGISPPSLFLTPVLLSARPQLPRAWIRLGRTGAFPHAPARTHRDIGEGGGGGVGMLVGGLKKTSLGFPL